MSNAEDLPTPKALSSDPYKPKSKKSHQINQLHRIRSPYSKPAGMAAIPDEEDEENGINKTVLPSTVTLNTRPAFSSYSSASMNSPNNYLSNLQADYHRRYPSKELFTIHQHPLHSSTSISATGRDPMFDESQSKSKFSIASTLVVTYLIEVAIQTFFIVQCCRLLLHHELELATGVASWSWFLIVSGAVSSFLVTLISIIWVFRGMDFSGRVCGRLLCYVMHSFLLGMFWRYLKLAFAYDKADLEEYFKLKTIQTYVQTLPLVTIHLAWVLTTQQQTIPEYPVESYHILSSWLVVTEMLCAVMSFLVLSTASLAPSSSSTCGNNNSNNLRGIVIVPSNSSSNRRKSNTRLKQENSDFSSDNNPNQHFNDSGTASTVADQQRNHCVIEDEKKSFCSFASFRAAVKWFVMCHHTPYRCELGRALLLLSRLISLGMLVYKMNYYWTGCIILLHLIVSSVWLGCWTLVSTNKKEKRADSLDNENNKTEKHPNKSDNQNEFSSDCCETRSSTSIDSGLVKSEVVVTQSGIPLTPENDQNQVDYDSFNGCARGYHHVDLNALSNCFTKVIIPRNINPTSFDSTTKNEQRWRRVRILILNRILPLTYLLFWDLNFTPVSNLFLYNKISLCATALPVFFINAENISIILYYLIWRNNENYMVFLSLASAACLLVGWTFIVAYHFQLRRYLKSKKVQRQVEQDVDPEAAIEHEDSGYVRKDIYGGGDSGLSSIKSSMNKKETGECLSICCSSLSHPLNIKRKGHRDQPQPTTDNSSEDNNFCKNDTNHRSATTSPSDPISMKKFNEYEEQQDLGKLMNPQSHHRQQHHCSHSHNSNERSGIRKEVTKFPDLGLPNDQSTKLTVMPKMHSEFECQENLMLMTCAKSNSTNITTPPTPVTNNYTNIKEALTRKISNKSCSSLKKQPPNDHHRHLHHHHYHHNKAMNQDECESVKGEGEEVCMEKGGKGMISSFKSSSSSSTPSTRQHQQLQQPPPPPSNSNKCMPISIKSPISWLPDSCCNDSSLNSGSSNSRNTNTLVTTTTTSSKLLYCPEKPTDLDNNNVEKAEKRTASSTTTSRHEQRQHHQHNIQNHPDFSIVFFEGRAGSCSRSYKQKQSRTPVASSALLGRTARSANATPIAYTKQRGKGGSRPCLEYNAMYDEDCDVDADQIVRTNARLEGSSARLRNQITGKTYLSDGASLTSLDGLCEIRASTPVEIKKASRVIVNYPPPHHQISDSKTVSRCLCKVESSPLQNSKKCVIQSRQHLVQSDEQISEGDEHEIRIVEKNGSSCLNNNNIYEKLIDDSYGILICEGEQHRQSPGSNNCIFIANDYPLHPSIRVTDCRSGDISGSVIPSSNQKLKILCAKCLENHDPLLTNCLESLQDHPKIVDHYAPNPVTPALMSKANAHHNALPHIVSHSPYADSDTTDYPSDTEFTATVNNAFEDDGQSLSTHFSSATYTWHHHHYPHNNYPHHYQQHQQQPTQLSQFIWAASQMMPTTTGSIEASADQQKRCPKEFTSLEYVQTWLLASHPRTFAPQNMNHNHNGSRNSPSINNTQQQHLSHRHNHHQQHENSIKARNDNENRYTSNKNGKRVLALSSPKNNGSIPFTNKSSLSDNKISKKNKRFRQLEKRQRPIGRGASPPAKELCSADDSNTNTNPGVVVEGENDVSEAISNAYSAAEETRFQPPPSRKQHPLLFYDMMPRQEEQKPLTATNPTTHKKCRDQLDLFHKELETVV